MLLAVDVGNSNIVIALYDNDTWIQTFRVETKENQLEVFYEQALRNILLEWSVHHSEVTDVVISSVVPDVNDAIKDAIFYVTGCKPLLINHETYKLLDLYVPHPYVIGSDIVANAYAAIKLFGDKCIIVDFGTALTFTVVNHEEGIKGVSIAPGLKTAIQSLSKQTAQLPIVPLELPDSAIGHDTISAIQAGVMWGYIGLVRQMLTSIKTELNDPSYKVIATGGLSSILAPLESAFDQIDKMLTLDGMRLIYYFIQNQKL